MKNASIRIPKLSLIEGGSMTINGINYRLTKHGRARFIERVTKGTVIPDTQIILISTELSKAIWKKDSNEQGKAYRLVTVLE